ncbi:MAG: hypothetical protein J7K68_04490 [Candidatus Diapherotrites archaeon]|nr:hypothetical protein [Candidatus Diapherotrites archaeon]
MKLTLGDWLEFVLSGLPPVDWYYALSHKPTRVEKALFPKFVKRPHKEWIIATAEHIIYLILGFCFTYFINLDWSLKVGVFAIFIVIPLEFLYFKWRVALFKEMDWWRLGIAALWNMFNILMYWLIGIAIALRF